MKQLEGGLIETAVIIHRQHVSTTLARFGHVTPKVPGDSAKVVFLVTVDRRFGGLNGARGARLHLYEAEDVSNIVVTDPADEIEFAVVVGRAVVARDDGVAVAPQVEVGIFFSATSDLEVLRGFVGREEFFTQPVECAESCLREASWEHCIA